jgi:CreA protein
MKFILFIFTLLIFPIGQSYAKDSREIGAISTGFKLIGPNHKIIVTAFEDPKVKGITCYVARPRTGGIKGGLGLAEDPSLASVSCAQTGPVSYSKAVSKDEDGEQVFDESRSIIFKTLDVKRLVDVQNGTLVYVVRTSRIIEGSPDTSVSVVAPIAWAGIAPQPINAK